VPGIVGNKEAGGDLVKAAEAIAQSDAGFTTVSGDDALTLPLLSLGGRGSISTTANVAPSRVKQLERAFRSGDVERAHSIHYELLELMQVLFIESNPIPLKSALYLMGRIPTATLRLPLTELQKGNRDRLESVLANLGLA
jgi:4-hydroxy-tetrahydrodipicolinate synthase